MQKISGDLHLGARSDDLDIVEVVIKRKEEKCKRYFVLVDLYVAQKRLTNYSIKLSVKRKEPTY